jgi:hypothetical protein
MDGQFAFSSKLLLNIEELHMTPYGNIARVSRPKLAGGGTHEGVLMQDGRVVDITQTEGYRILPLQEFAQNYPVKVEAVLARDQHAKAVINLRAVLKEKKPYDPLFHNCEVVARKILGETPISPQAVFWGAAAAIVLYLMMSE